MSHHKKHTEPHQLPVLARKWLNIEIGGLEL